jgi:hypothetical protein
MTGSLTFFPVALGRHMIRKSVSNQLSRYNKKVDLGQEKYRKYAKRVFFSDSVKQ